MYTITICYRLNFDRNKKNALHRFHVLWRDLVHALRKKRPHLNFDKKLFNQDNDPAHTAAATLLDSDLLAFEILPH